MKKAEKKALYLSCAVSIVAILVATSSLKENLSCAILIACLAHFIMFMLIGNISTDLDVKWKTGIPKENGKYLCKVIIARWLSGIDYRYTTGDYHAGGWWFPASSPDLNVEVAGWVKIPISDDCFPRHQKSKGKSDE